MDYSLISIVFVAVTIAGFVAWLIYLQRKAAAEEGKKVEGSKVMQLQAYERLALLIDRITLSNVISRVSDPEFTARDMQRAIVQSINEEFNYNITQQIYVSAEAWDAVKNLKEQNLLLVNQLASIHPPTASGIDLSRSLLEFLMNDKRGTLHEVVSEVISFEAKKLL
ncbi:hypothetical protein [Parasediminibacterium sp. JCM 36343]|uniref:DUF7935 family protein n=1 Tax=Parasediminibacterium sp. JCM 36343 TaxID=3374279 RepID=UPI003978BBA6